ncbi:MAG: hypothetical protein HYZ53_01490 [Planctomycetes bacterium]|nr:hypothetical protein [Planctomycetota bacterium]
MLATLDRMEAVSAEDAPPMRHRICECEERVRRLTWREHGLRQKLLRAMTGCAFEHDLQTLRQSLLTLCCRIHAERERLQRLRSVESEVG